MVSEQLLITFVYETTKKGLGWIGRSIDHQQAVRDAADSIASDGPDGLSGDDFYGIFQTELDGDILAGTDTDSDKIVSLLADALSNRHYSANSTGSCEPIDYELLIIDFLDLVERNLLSQGRPEEGIQVLYQYARETSLITEQIQTAVEQLHDHYIDDLEQLSRYSARMAPGKQRYHLSDTIPRIKRSVEDDVQQTIENGDSVILTGQAGTGKSGVLAYLYEKWQGHRPVYFLDAREFGHLQGRNQLKGELEFRQPITEVFKRIGEEAGCCTIFVDQLDNVRTEDAATLFKNLLTDLAALDTVTVLCACRRWDLDRIEFDSFQDSPHFVTHTVPTLDEDSIRNVLCKAGVDEDDQTSELLALCQNPLNLSLLVEAMNTDETLELRRIKAEHALWDAYRESLEHEGSQSEGIVPNHWDQTPVQRAVMHARESLQQGRTTFPIEDSNSADQRLISRRTIEQDWKASYRFRHDQLQTYFFAWRQVTRDRYIDSVLGTGIDERLAADVFEWMLKLYLEDESRVTKFLREGVGSRSTLEFYTRLRIIETVRALDPDRLGMAPATVVINALESDDALAREFYRDTESPAWARFLLDNDLIAHSDTIVASYIASLVEEALGLTVEGMQWYDPSSVTPSVLRAYLSVLEADNVLNSDYASVVGEAIVCWVEAFNADELAEFRFGAETILGYLVQTNQQNLAIRLISRLIEPNSDRNAEFAENDSDRIAPSRRVAASIDIPQLDRLFDQYSEEVYEVSGSKFLDVLEEGVQECLEIVSQRFSEDIPTERAFRRPLSLSSLNPRTLQEVLVPTLETILRHQMSTDPDAARKRLEQYLDSDGVFREIAVHLLSKDPTVAPGAVASVLTSPPRDEAVPLQTAFLRLLKSGYPYLSEADQQTVLDYIRSGPDREKLEQNLREWYEWDSEQQLQDEVQLQIERWQLKRLWQIRDHLSTESKYYTQLDELVDQYGPVEYKSHQGFVIQSSDDESEETNNLSEMDVQEFIDYCLEYAKNVKPTVAGPDITVSGPGLKSPSGELRNRIGDDPETYLPHLPKIVDNSTGNDTLVKTGFETVLLLMSGDEQDEKDVIEWDTIVETYERFIATDSIEERWQLNCRRSASELAFYMIANTQVTFEAADHPQLLTDVVLQLTADPDPVPETPIESQLDDDQTLQNPRIREASGVRASGASALVTLLLTLNNASVEAETSINSLRDRLDELFRDDATSVRFALGQHLTRLHAYDSEFVENRTDLLLPVGDSPEDRTRFVSFWSGYINHDRLTTATFEFLAPCYQYAIDLHLTEKIKQHDRSLQPLCWDIAVAYVWGYLDANATPIEKLLQVTRNNLALDQDDPGSALPRVLLARSFADILRRSEDEERQYEHWQRIIDFWEHRIATVSSIANADEEFRAYTRILRRAPSSVSLAEVAPILENTAPVIQSGQPFRNVVEFLAEQVTFHREEVDTSKAAIEILAKLTRTIDLGIHLIASDECWTVVKTATEHNHDTALEVADQLLEAGHPEYRQLIEKHRYDGRSPNMDYNS